MGYAGAARGEIPSAEQIAEMDADAITIAYGTNCWVRTPHSAEMVEAGFAAFLDVVRQGHPDTPLVVVSPILRPDAETTPNRLGATLQDIRAAIERVAEDRDDVALVGGVGILAADLLGDGIHPNDEGHQALADAVGPVVHEVLG